MAREKKDVEAALEDKGFQRGEGDHHYFIYWSLAGKKTMAKTKTSHGSGRDISDDLLSKMARQCGVTKPNFKFVDCSLERPEYENLLRQAGKF
jgi:hypothetical protein